MYKCDQCEYLTIKKRSLNLHSLKHKNSDKIDMYKCDQCEYTERKNQVVQVKYTSFN